MPDGESGRSRATRRVGQPDATWADASLVAACLRGNEQAWTALIAKYKNLIYSIPLKYGAGPQDAADIFQAVCVELVSELPRLRNPEALRPWIIRVTANQCFHWKRKLRLRAEETLSEQLEEQCPSDPLPDVVEEVEREQMIREAISRLSPRCQEIIRLLFYEPEPISYRDLARRLGLATGSIGFIRGRCLKRLERALEELGF